MRANNSLLLLLVLLGTTAFVSADDTCSQDSDCAEGLSCAMLQCNSTGTMVPFLTCLNTTDYCTGFANVTVSGMVCSVSCDDDMGAFCWMDSDCYNAGWGSN